MAVTARAEARRRDSAMARDPLAWLRAHRETALVLALGLLIRAVLLPLTSGGDFNMWNLTAAAALHGQDTYAHPPLPIHQAGPYAYFPLYLYILLPLKWLSLHTSLPYVVLGKLPVVLGDVVVALALAGVLRRAGLRERAAALGAALFFLNPLVLYNGAFYGRFDSLCLATLLLAWRYLERPGAQGRGGWLALWYALGVTLKTFPIFLLPYLLVRAGLRRGLPAALAAFALPLVVSLPYLLDNARRFVYIVFVYDSTKGPRQFSWQFALLDLGLPARTVTLLSYGLLALFALGLLLPLLPRHIERRALSYGNASPAYRHMNDPYAYAAVAYVLFLLFSKVVYEQYFLWPLPFLAVLVLRDRDRAAALLLAVLSVTGLLANTWIHPFGYRPGPALWLNALIAAAAASFVLSRWRVRAAHSAETPSTSA